MRTRGNRTGAVLCCIAWMAMQVLPLVHDLHHAHEHVERQLQVAAQSDHVHTSDAGFSTALDGDGHRVALCLTCTTVLSAAPNAPDEAHVRVDRRVWAVVADDQLVPSSDSTCPIRAPPAAG